MPTVMFHPPTIRRLRAPTRFLNRTKASVLAVALGMAALALVACNGASEEPTAAATATPRAVGTAAPTVERPGPAIAPSLRGTATATPGEATGPGGVPLGGEFRRLWADPPTLDPHVLSDTTSAAIVVEIFSGLVSLSPELQIQPELAESWDITGAGTVYTFTLRDGITFSNGDPVTARDFKWSLERAAHPDTESPVAEMYLADIVGIQDIIDGRGSVTEASGIEVIDGRTLRITIDAPKAYFLAKLTYPTAYVVNRENVTTGGEGWTDDPIGTGPFVLEQYKIGQRLVLARNDRYWGRKAYLDRVDFNLSGGVPMAMYENDEMDFTGVGLADLERVQDPAEPLNKDLISVPPAFSVSYIGFNTAEPPFDDPKFRQALNHAVDKEIIASQVYSDLVKPAYAVLPPGFPGYSEDIEGLRFDADLARQLLQESKYADPETRPRIVVTIPGTGGSPSLDIEVVADMWEKVLAVEIEIQQVEWATYLQDLNRKRLQAWGGLGWEADYPDPQDFIDILFHSDSPGNHGAYSNAEVDRLVEQARTEQDIARRIELYNQAERIIVEEAAWMPLWFDTDGLALVKPRIKGYKFTPIIVPKLKDVYIALD